MNEDDPVLDHRSRKRVVTLIRSRPGVTFSEIQGICDINESTLRYHVRYLIKHQKVSEVKSGGLRYYYPYSMTNDTIDDPSLLLGEREVLDVIIDNPGVTLQELSDITRKQKKIISKALKKLRAHQYIWKVRSGREWGYEYITELKVRDEMKRILVDRFINGDIDNDRFLILLKGIDEEY